MLDMLRWLGVPESERAPIAESAPLDRTALEQVTAALLRDLGTFTTTVNWPPYEGYFPLHAFLSVLPQVREWHAQRRIPEDISRKTMAQLGSRVQGGEVIRKYWFTHHFRGTLYRLGRLQFDRTSDGHLEVHVPDGAPLTPEACDESLAAVRPFFAEHFPDETYREARCVSWLLDPQLADYLPPDSNILNFQRRFTLVHPGEPADEEILNFVAEGTILHRTVLKHLAQGKHWYHVVGVLPIDPG